MQLRFHIAIAVLAATAIALPSCKKREATGSEPNAERAATGEPADTLSAVDQAFVVARPKVTEAPVPPRFSAPLPTSLAELERVESYPPVQSDVVLDSQSAGAGE